MFVTALSPYKNIITDLSHSSLRVFIVLICGVYELSVPPYIPVLPLASILRRVDPIQTQGGAVDAPEGRHTCYICTHFFHVNHRIVITDRLVKASFQIFRKLLVLLRRIPSLYHPLFCALDYYQLFFVYSSIRLPRAVAQIEVNIN